MQFYGFWFKTGDNFCRAYAGIIIYGTYQLQFLYIHSAKSK